MLLHETWIWNWIKWEEAGPEASTPAGVVGGRHLVALHLLHPWEVAAAFPAVAQSAPLLLLFHDLGSHLILGNKYLSAYINPKCSICSLQLNATYQPGLEPEKPSPSPPPLSSQYLVPCSPIIRVRLACRWTRKHPSWVASGQALCFLSLLPSNFTWNSTLRISFFNLRPTPTPFFCCLQTIHMYLGDVLLHTASFFSFFTSNEISLLLFSLGIGCGMKNGERRYILSLKRRNIWSKNI